MIVGGSVPPIRQEVASLRTEREHTKETVSDLKSDLTRVSTDVAELNGKVTAIGTKVEGIEATIKRVMGIGGALLAVAQLAAQIFFG